MDQMERNAHGKRRNHCFNILSTELDIYLFIYLCHISLQWHHTSYSTLQSVQEADDKIYHLRARQWVLALASKKKKKLFLQVFFGHGPHILYHNKLPFGSEGCTQRESVCAPFFSCSFIFISTVGLSS